MYELWARRRIDNHDDLITTFDDARQFDFMADQVDREKYKEICILTIIDHYKVSVYYREFKEYKPYVKMYREKKGK